MKFFTLFLLFNFFFCNLKTAESLAKTQNVFTCYEVGRVKVCQKKFNSLRALKKHIKESHQLSSTQCKYRCQKCKKSYTSLSVVIHHEKACKITYKQMK